MKPLLTVLLVLGASILAFTQANTKLSNLVAPTAINQHLLPSTTNARDLGTSTLAWRNQYLRGDVYLDGTRFISNHPGTASFNAFVGSNAGFDITTGTNNSALGHYALNNTTSGYSNQAFGAYALYTNTTGYSNLAAGTRSLYSNTTGVLNVAIGDTALFSNTTGLGNSALGYKALYSNTIGIYNTALGIGVLQSNTTGYQNTAAGSNALSRNTTGVNNTAIGTSALAHNATGYGNTALGMQALLANQNSANTGIGAMSLRNTTNSQFNTAIGVEAGTGYNHGWNNVFVGAQTTTNGAGYYNVIAIGQGTIVAASNQARFGNPSTKMYNAYAGWTIISDGRYKKNLNEDVPGISFIAKLRPVTYNLDASGLAAFIETGRAEPLPMSTEAKDLMENALKEKEAIVQTGFVAQEVEQAAKDLNYNFSGVYKPANNKDVYGLSYADFVVPLVKAVQELDEKTKEIEDLKARMAKMEDLIIRLTGQGATVTGMGSLSQNTPNPVRGTTRISYTIPAGANRAQLLLTDKLGKLVKTIPIALSPSGTAVINTSMLSSGVYNYSLVVDGKTVETKKMVVVHNK